MLSRWVAIAERGALGIVLLWAVLTGLMFLYTAQNLGINTDTSEMLSEDLPWRQDYRSYKAAFPQNFREILIVIDALTPDLADQAGEILAARLAQETDLFNSVYRPGSGKFFNRHGLLYLELPDLQDLSDNLARVQPFLGKLVQDQSLVGLVNMLSSGMEAADDGEALDLVPVFDRMGEAFQARVENRFYQVSWQELMLGRTSEPDERRRFIVVQPQVDYSELLQGETAMAKIRNLARELRLDEAHGVRVRMTGSVALANEEMRSVTRGAGFSVILAMVIVAIVLYVGLGSFRLMISCLITLASGLIATSAFAAYAVGHLNLISMAFAVLYIGLGIDYAIHLSLRYRELLGQGCPHAEALRKAAGDVGTSLVLCAVTTSAAFYAFIPTAYTGVAELGLISGTGMLISLLLNLTLLPALMHLMPLSHTIKPPNSVQKNVIQRLVDVLLNHRWAIRAGVVTVTAASVVLLFKVQFDFNPMNLRNPQSESIITYHDLLKSSATSPLTISILSPDEKAAREAAKRLKKLDVVDKVLIAEDFVPEAQEEKLGIIEEMALLLGPELEFEDTSEPPDAAQRLRSLEELRTGLEAFLETSGPEHSTSAEKLLGRVKRFELFLEKQPVAQQNATLDSLEASLIGSLPDRIKLLRSSLDAGPIAFRDLPLNLTGRWVTQDGRYRTEVFPRDRLSENEDLSNFVRQVQGEERTATGLAVVMLEAGDSVVQAFRQAFVYALISLFLILTVLLQTPRDAFWVLLPMLLAGLLTGAATVLLKIPFNFANIIALPLLLGIGVDNGVHMVYRFRTIPAGNGNLLTTSTARAVLFSALTTVAGFGGLAFSSHPGMASMGQLLAIGLSLTVACTLIVLPILLVVRSRGT